MKRYIFTGTPGSGKTSVLHELKRLGYCVIEEAATDVISLERSNRNPEPWLQADFIDNIVQLQRQRQIESVAEKIQYYDRSPICTSALSRYLGYLPSDSLLEELERIKRERIYEQQVFFFENLGFIEHTEARKISFENALIFEKIHEEAYTELKYKLIKVPLETVSNRARYIMEWIA